MPDAVAGPWPERCTRVVFFGPRLPEISGGSTYVMNMSAELVERGVEVEHVSLAPGTVAPRFPTFVVNPRPALHAGPSFRTRGRRGGRMRGLGAAVFKAADRRWQAWRLRRRFSGYGPETLIVLTHVRVKQTLDASGWVRPTDGPLLVGQHHSQFETIDLYADAWMRPAMVAHFGDLDVFTALTQSDARRFAEILPVPCVAIGNPAPPAPPSETPRERLAVALARYSLEKDLDIMIRCFAEATDVAGLDGWRLELWGEGPTREALQDQIDRLEVGERIRLMGRADDVHEVLSRARVNLLTSSTEGFGMAVLEAATAGVPSIVFDCSPGLRELVELTHGHLVPDQDTAAYVQCLIASLGDADDLARRGALARHGATRFAPGPIVDVWADLVTEAYARRSRR